MVLKVYHLLNCNVLKNTKKLQVYKEIYEIISGHSYLKKIGIL